MASLPPRADPPQHDTVALASDGILPHPSVQSSKTRSACIFFDKFPLEVRRDIYKYLLVNPMLGHSEMENHSYGDNGQSKYIEYDLSPSLLLTCRQMYIEAADVLYGCNTYYLYCFPDIPHVWEFNPSCPILRHGDTYSTQPPFNENKAAAKVRHWKILVSSYSKESSISYSPNPSLLEASRLMHTSRPQSADILVIPQGVEAMPGLGERYQNIHEVLRPLHLVRFPKGLFAISDASFDEIKISVHNLRLVPQYVSQIEGNNSQDALVELINSNAPVEMGSEMYSRLLSYSRSFERYTPYRAEMGLRSGEFLSEYDVGPLDRRYYRLQLGNPFRRWLTHDPFHYFHPVEEALHLARSATELEDIVEFKEKRADALEYLEPQYQRIMNTSTNIREFIQRQKRRGGVFDLSDSCNCFPACSHEEQKFCHLQIDPVADGLVLLEQYAASFVRDAPVEVLREIKKQQREFDSHYFHPEREELLAKMNREFEFGDNENYVELFKRAFTNMEQQRLEILHTRKELFKSDLANDKRCNIESDADCGSHSVVDWDTYDEVDAEEE
jgi:hypothetical protein